LFQGPKVLIGKFKLRSLNHEKSFAIRLLEHINIYLLFRNLLDFKFGSNSYFGNIT
jgi:hypothetical protein